MNAKEKPDDLPMGYFIILLAKYYCSNGIESEKLVNTVKRAILEFDLENYQEYKYHNKIVSICKALSNEETEKKFKEREYIPIYESELNVVNTLKNDRQKKLMFTFFAVARYMECDGWINKKTSKEISEVFKLANVILTSEKKNALLYELYRDGYIFFGKKVNNLNIRVQLDNTGDIVYKVREFKNLGNQYIGNFKKGYKQCQCCGKKYKVKSRMDRSSKYCNECAKDVTRENWKLSKQRLRN